MPSAPATERDKTIRRLADTSTFVHDAMAFERAVLDALRSGKGPFAPARINSNVKIVSKYGGARIYDAIVETPQTHYVVEVKSYRRTSNLITILQQLESDAVAYRKYLLERGISTTVVPVVVVPSELNAPALYRDVLPVLSFDMKSHKFTNINEFKQTLLRINI